MRLFDGVGCIQWPLQLTQGGSEAAEIKSEEEQY